MALAETLVDAFDDNSLNTGLWTGYADAGTSLAETSQRLELTLRANGNGYAGVFSVAQYDLTGSSVSVECVDRGSGGSGQTSSIEVDFDASNSLKVITDGTGIMAQTVIAGANNSFGIVTYSAVLHRWWRIREAGGTVYFEASPTGAAGSWTALYSRANPFALTALTLKLFAGTYSSVATPGVARFDNFNVPGVANPLVGTLTDDFEAGTLDAAKWATFTQGTGSPTVAVSGGRLGVATTGTNGNYAGVASVRRYDLTGSAIKVDLAEHAPYNTSGRISDLILELDANNWIGIRQDGGTCYPEITLNGSPVALGGSGLNVFLFRWLQIREAGGTVYFERSPDGLPGHWTVQDTRTVATLFPVTALTVKLRAGQSTATIAGQSYFDNVNVDVGQALVWGASATPAWTATSGAAVTPTLPNGYEADDILLLLYNGSGTNPLVALPAGWTQLTALSGNNSTVMRVEVWWKRATASETAPAVNITPASNYVRGATIVSVRGALKTGDPFGTCTRLDNGAANAINFTNVTDAPARSAAVAFGAYEDDPTAPSMFRWSLATANGTNTITTTTLGNDALIIAGSRTVPDGGAVDPNNTILQCSVSGGSFQNSPSVGIILTLKPQGLIPTTNVTVTAGIATAEAVSAGASLAVGTPTLAVTGIASAGAFGTAQLQPGPVQVSATGVASAEALGTPAVVPIQTVTVAGIASAQALGGATVTPGVRTVLGTGVASAGAFGTPAVAPGVVAVAPTGVASAQALGAPAIVTGGLAVAPAGIASAQAFGTASVFVPGAGLVFQRWDGSAWQPATVRRWDGSAWVPAVAKRWNGTGWS